MKALRFPEAQKAFILKQGHDGTPVAEICRKAGISRATYFLEEEVRRLPTEMRRPGVPELASLTPQSEDYPMVRRAIMSEKARTVQDVFLGHLREHKTPVTIFLMNGIKLQGIVSWFDRFSLVLRRDRQSQLVYKSTISTITPMMAVQLFDSERSPPQGKATLSLRS